MTTTAEHVSALIGAMFDNAVSTTAPREQAHSFVTALSPDEIVVSLEVSRDRGDWQRNLVLTISAAGSAHEIEAKITDDEQLPIANIGQAEVSSPELADVALSIARAGLARLGRELVSAQPVSAA